MKTLYEGLLSDFDTLSKEVEDNMYLDQYNEFLKARNSRKKCEDLFGREIKVGDICLASVEGCEWHFIQVKEIIGDGGWFDIIPTVDYSYIGGRNTINPSVCMLIPKNQQAYFLKFLKAKK